MHKRFLVTSALISAVSLVVLPSGLYLAAQFDGVGKLVQQRKQALADGNNLLRFDLFSQARGVYYVQMAEENGKVLAMGSVIRN